MDFSFFWPPVEDISQAKKAAQYGFGAAIISALIGVGYLTYDILSKTPYDGYQRFSMILIPALLAFFISRMSRTAAILALAVSSAEVINNLIVRGTPGVMLLFMIFYIGAIRGTFAYHKFKIIEKDIQPKEKRQ